MKKIVFLSSVVALLLSVATACSFVIKTQEEVSKDFLSSAEKISQDLDQIFQYAGTTADKAEIIEINMSHSADDTTDIKNDISAVIIDPADKNLIKRYFWFDNKDMRNSYKTEEVTITDFAGTEVIEGYDKYKDMITTYADFKPYIDNYDTYCQEALTAAGSEGNGDVRDYSYSKERGGSITIGYRGKDVSKSFDIAEDKKHIKK